MAITIREATHEDLPEILEIINHAILHTTANYNYEPQTLQETREWFEKKHALNFPVLVADLQGKAIGYSSYGSFREKTGYQFTVEHSVYVNPAHHGKGIGKMLLSELISIARQNGFHLMVGGIDASNSESIAFHEKFGFESCGIIRQAAFKFDKWLDLLFMQKLL